MNSSSSSLENCDSLCLEYLLFRGFTQTVIRLQAEKSSKTNYKSLLFSPDKLVSCIFDSLSPPSPTSPTSHKDFNLIWNLLSQRFFHQVVNPSINECYSDLLKLYLVNCVTSERLDLVFDFFKEMMELEKRDGRNDSSKKEDIYNRPPFSNAQNANLPASAATSTAVRANTNPTSTPLSTATKKSSSSSAPPIPPPAPSLPSSSPVISPKSRLPVLSFREWHSLPYTSNPQSDPAFSIYFSPHWQNSLKVTLYNLLSSVINSSPLPRFVVLERWSKTDQQLKQRMKFREVSSALDSEKVKVKQLEVKLARMKVLTKRLVNVVSQELHENSRKVKLGVGSMSNMHTKDLFKEENESIEQKKVVLKVSEEAVKCGVDEGGFEGVVGRFLDELERE